jgi:hypothetical protein
MTAKPGTAKQSNLEPFGRNSIRITRARCGLFGTKRDEAIPRQADHAITIVSRESQNAAASTRLAAKVVCGP